jgi:uncharacterized protein (TIGR01319 family)
MRTEPESLHTVLVTDCGSTTTKALLFERRPEGWRQTFRGEAPTTVEEPVADVTVGAINSFREVQELSGREIIDSNGSFIVTTDDPSQGIDLYLSTSSAGGGLQMLVAGVVRTLSTESAERAALGAGAIVMEAVSVDDGREDHERIERIRHIKPDIVLLTGGIDGGSTTHVVEMAEILVAAAPRPRFGDTLTLPVIYAGNRDAAQNVCAILGKLAKVLVVDNVRPTLDTENIAPAREAIHEFFLSHVMSHSPGYGKLLSWTPVAVMPTPAAVGDMVNTFAKQTNQSVLCVDIGGATTDVFSVFPSQDGTPVSNRTVSANLGMSYSIANVLVEAGAAGIRRWLPFDIVESDLRDRLRNKMIRPTSIPQTVEDLWLEQAVCREALRLSLNHHRSLAIGVSGQSSERGIADVFSQRADRYELVDMLKLDIVIGSGGVLSHAPSRVQAALMMTEGFGLEGVTQLAVDSIFMLPHLGVFASVHAAAAQEIFERDCIVYVGVAVVPRYLSTLKKGTILADIFVDGELRSQIVAGEVHRLAVALNMTGILAVVPRHRSVEVGAGPGNRVEREVRFGECGVIMDGRNRPFRSDCFTSEAQHIVYKNVGLLKDHQ